MSDHEVVDEKPEVESTPKTTETATEAPEDTTAATPKPEGNDGGEESGDDMPPLEDIKYDDETDDAVKKKRIVIPEDKPKPKPAEDGWLDVLDNGELRKFVLTPGAVGQPRPERGCIVAIKLVVKLEETQAVVESESHELTDMIVGDSDLFQGLDLIIPLMDQKEVARVVVSSRFAYGKTGIPGAIPPDASLDCELHLLSVQWLDEEFVLPIVDRIRIGNRKKERGNFWFGRQEYSTCIQCYKSAIKLLDATDEELESLDTNELKEHFDQQMKGEKKSPEDEERVKELVDIRGVTYNNLAMAQMKIDDFSGALTSVEAVLVTQPNNVKALFRKGRILAEKGELEDAIKVLKTGLTLEPDNKAIAQELNKYSAKRKKELVTERDLYKRMLQTDKSSPPTTPSKGLWGRSSVTGLGVECNC
ncbi:unnamed protein product [Medioppia subpectinata]|uniref:peptidylprolyl isomerase n=1 Tax=Medioppia subpectinata TaxID=1979941 RepID=A0A7R9KIK4_9ACAR|nr:unnamed protein product [Medioppia subpectinata]CAG2102831.1 unnamed protein product [Medioppia subpectinata]